MFPKHVKIAARTTAPTVVFLRATPGAIISPRPLTHNDFLAFVQIAAWRYVTTNQEALSRFAPSTRGVCSSVAHAPLVRRSLFPHPVFFAPFRSRAWRRRLRRLLARTRSIARLDKGDRHQRPAQRRLRIPSASRTAISGASDPNTTVVPAEACPCPLAHRRAAYRAPVPWSSNFSARDCAPPRSRRRRSSLATALRAIRGFAHKEFLYTKENAGAPTPA